MGNTRGNSRSRWRLPVLAGVLLLLLVSLPFLGRLGQAHGPDPRDKATRAQNISANSPSSKTATAGEHQLTSTAVPGSQVGAGFPGTASKVNKGPKKTNTGRVVDPETMVRSLLMWAKEREGKDVRLVQYEKVLDLDGTPTGLNVILTTRGDADVSIDGIKEKIRETTRLEQADKERLSQEKKAGEVGQFNERVAGIIERRSKLVEEQGVISYKLSMNSSDPPILAFWPGLPFEVVRQEVAKELAEKTLQQPVSLTGLTRFTVTTSLLCFASADGQRVYVDPFRLTTVSGEALAQVGKHRKESSDAARAQRIADQWTQFLKESNPPREGQ